MYDQPPTPGPTPFTDACIAPRQANLPFAVNAPRPPSALPPAPDAGQPWARALVAVSEGLLRAERAAVTGLMALLFALILLNVGSRYGGFPIFWVDEAAVFAVVWLTFIGASAMSRLRLDFAVTLLTDAVPARVLPWLRRAAAAVNLLFMVALVVMCAWWLDPLGLARAGFDAKAFAGESFNFIYTERTQTLNWPTWVLYLIMPIFAVSMMLHGLANALEDLGLAPRAALPGFPFGDASGIN